MRRRAAAVVAALVLAVAGCGGGDDPPDDRRGGPEPQIGDRKLDEAEKALEKLKDSDLPEDARKELEEAKRLLDEARG